MAAKLTSLTHKIAIQLNIVAESCTICSSRSRRPVRKLLDTLSYNKLLTPLVQSPSWDANSHSVIKKVPPSIEPKGSLSCSQNPATEHHPEPAPFTLHLTKWTQSTFFTQYSCTILIYTQGVFRIHLLIIDLLLETHLKCKLRQKRFSLTNIIVRRATIAQSV
jgi:hypothetical protein